MVAIAVAKTPSSTTATRCGVSGATCNATSPATSPVRKRIGIIISDASEMVEAALKSASLEGRSRARIEETA